MNEILQNYLLPPGFGVYTVNTAKDKKATLHQSLFNTTDSDIITKQFNAELLEFKALDDKKIALLGICSDTGGGIQRGANWGPLFIREKLYQTSCKERLIDLGDTRVIPHLLHDKYLNENTIAHCQEALYGEKNNLAVSPLSIAEETLNFLYQHIADFKLLGLGGDHSVSYPLVKTYLQSKQDKKIALVHFDAHTDLLVERLGIDLCFGSWLTHVLPFMDADNVIQLGIRSTGKTKAHWQSTFGIKQHWAEDIKNKGMASVIASCIKHFKTNNIDELYISFDIDALDAKYASATGTPEENGLTVEESLYAINALANEFNVTGADLVEVAPFVNANADTDEPDTTLHSATQIAEVLIKALSG